MSGFRPTGIDSGMQERMIYPGDLMLGGESITAGNLTLTAIAITIPAASIATGITKRSSSGATAATTETTDTATNIVAAIAANMGSGVPAVVSGTSWRWLYLNNLTANMTLAAGVGVALGTGATVCSAAFWREYLVTVLNADQAITVPGIGATAAYGVTGTGLSAYFAFNFALPLGQSGGLLLSPNIPKPTVGQTVQGTGFTASGITVGGLIYGAGGGVVGAIISASSTVTIGGQIALAFGPSVQIDGLRGGTL